MQAACQRELWTTTRARSPQQAERWPPPAGAEQCTWAAATSGTDGEHGGRGVAGSDAGRLHGRDLLLGGKAALDARPHLRVRLAALVPDRLLKGAPLPLLTVPAQGLSTLRMLLSASCCQPLLHILSGAIHSGPNAYAPICYLAGCLCFKRQAPYEPQWQDHIATLAPASTPELAAELVMRRGKGSSVSARSTGSYLMTRASRSMARSPLRWRVGRS